LPSLEAYSRRRVKAKVQNRRQKACATSIAGQPA
jgi:hypothetical protein